jgi:hypothetical protein
MRPEAVAARLPGVELYVDVAGEGAPVALVHAGICDSRMWEPQWAAFTAAPGGPPGPAWLRALSAVARAVFATATATPPSPPIPASANTPGWTPATAPTRGSRIAFAAAGRSGWAVSQPHVRDQPSLAGRNETANDLLAFTRTLLLHDTRLARAEPKKLRHRLLHVAARLTRGQRRLWLRIDQHWPRTRHLAAAFARLPALPIPAG